MEILGSGGCITIPVPGCNGRVPGEASSVHRKQSGISGASPVYYFHDS